MPVLTRATGRLPRFKSVTAWTVHHGMSWKHMDWRTGKTEVGAPGGWSSRISPPSATTSTRKDLHRTDEEPGQADRRDLQRGAAAGQRPAHGTLVVPQVYEQDAERVDDQAFERAAQRQVETVTGDLFQGFSRMVNMTCRHHRALALRKDAAEPSTAGGWSAARTVQHAAADHLFGPLDRLAQRQLRRCAGGSRDAARSTIEPH